MQRCSVKRRSPDAAVGVGGVSETVGVTRLRLLVAPLDERSVRRLFLLLLFRAILDVLPATQYSKCIVKNIQGFSVNGSNVALCFRVAARFVIDDNLRRADAERLAEDERLAAIVQLNRSLDAVDVGEKDPGESVVLARDDVLEEARLSTHTSHPRSITAMRC